MVNKSDRALYVIGGIIAILYGLDHFQNFTGKGFFWTHFSWALPIPANRSWFP